MVHSCLRSRGPRRLTADVSRRALDTARRGRRLSSSIRASAHVRPVFLHNLHDKNTMTADPYDTPLRLRSGTTPPASPESRSDARSTDGGHCVERAG
jgi:hypothetical protein